MLSRILMDPIRMPRRLPFEDEGSNVTHVFMHGWWCVVGW